MWETMPAAGRAAGVFASAIVERRRLLLVRGSILCALEDAVVQWPLQRLNELPPDIAFGEGQNGMNALQLL